MKKILPLLIIVACTSQQETLPETITTTTIVQEITTTTQEIVKTDQLIGEIKGDYYLVQINSYAETYSGKEINKGDYCIIYIGEDLTIDGEVYIYQGDTLACYENIEEAEDSLVSRRSIDRYRKNWVENHLIDYPDLTKEEYNITLQLYNDIESYDWNRGYDFTAIIDSQELYNRSINNHEILEVAPGKEFYCMSKDSGMAIEAFANEQHPLYSLKYNWATYQINVEYTCTQNEEDWLWLFGPIFYQDNQWWGFVYYDEDYYERYQDIEEFKVPHAFMAKFVKRISLGDISITSYIAGYETSEASEETTTTSVASTSQTSPSIVFINCVDTEITEDTYELTYDVIAGSEDINNFFVSTYKNGEYVSRAYFDKETNPGVGLFPLANTTHRYGLIVDNSDSTGTNSYEITISVMDEGVGEATEQCTLLMKNE